MTQNEPKKRRITANVWKFIRQRTRSNDSTAHKYLQIDTLIGEKRPPTCFNIIFRTTALSSSTTNRSSSVQIKELETCAQIPWKAAKKDLNCASRVELRCLIILFPDSNLKTTLQWLLVWISRSKFRQTHRAKLSLDTHKTIVFLGFVTYSGNSQKVLLTGDVWLFSVYRRYMTVTAFWVDGRWKIYSIVLKLNQFIHWNL